MRNSQVNSNIFDHIKKRQSSSGTEHGHHQKAKQRQMISVQVRSLPVRLVQQQLITTLNRYPISIIAGETGSGKSTQIPQMCLSDILPENSRIAVTQPRRVAAVSLARRVAEEMDVDLGSTVGYKVRFENVSGETSRILFCTDGMLLREALYDNFLSAYSLIIVDEAHERSLHTDVLMYILKRAHCARNRTEHPLKLLIMSATLDTKLLSEYFYDAPVISIEGRLFPIELFYANLPSHSNDDYVFNALVTILHIHRKESMSSGILVFLTGQEEIEAACKQIRELSDKIEGNILALPLYASLSPFLQNRVFESIEDSNTRKVVFSTNVAETSVTIPGIRIVVDSGRVKMRTFIPDRRIDVLRVESVSRTSATQRAGRAGREAAGQCYRLYSEEDFEKFESSTKPEILRSNLCSVLLDLYRFGFKKLKTSFLLSIPSDESVMCAKKQLKMLKAIQVDEKERAFLTDLGVMLSNFPIDPSLARFIIASSELGCVEEALTIASFMATDSIYISSSSLDRSESSNTRKKFEAAEGDHITMLNIYKCYRSIKNEKRDWCANNMINDRVMITVVKIRRQLHEICLKNGFNFRSCGSNYILIRKALCMGLFMNCCQYDRKTDSYELKFGPSTMVKIHPSSCLSRSRPTSFIFSDLVKTSQLYARDITVIDAEWVEEIIRE